MPCFRCRVRQSDPERGASPWRRAVVDGEQVLVCPGCQRASDWAAGLDRCARCGSVHLAKALGVVLCRDCGARDEPVPARHSGPAGAGDTGRPVGAAGPGEPTRASGPPGPAGAAGVSGSDSSAVTAGPPGSLSAEVDAALARILGRGRS